MKKTKLKKKIHPYTQESLSLKEKYLKLLITLIESVLLLPVVSLVLEYINSSNRFLILPIFIVVFLILYGIKHKRKKYKFSKWIFLDDKLPIFTDKKLDGEISDIYVSKFVIMILANILLIIPISLTFSAIISSAICFVIGLLIKDMIILNIIKFVLIYIFFKNFFGAINTIFINYIKEKKELDY